MISAAQPTLTGDEREGIVLAAKSVFKKLSNLYAAIAPTFQAYGFSPPSPGVIARDLSEKIEVAIVQHCQSFSKGVGHCDLAREGHPWEVKIAKGSGLTINQSKQVAGENYVVVNYAATKQGSIAVKKIWVLWNAQDEWFSPRKANTNARAIRLTLAQSAIEVLFSAMRGTQASLPELGKPKSAKVALPNKAANKHTA